MKNGVNAEIAFQTLERRLDLRQLHITIPQHGGIFRHQIGAQQIMTVAPEGVLNFV